MTWEEAVAWLRSQPDRQDLVQACFFDDPLLEAARRYRQCAEWQAVCQLLPKTKGKVLDLGSGRGISAYALAADGWETTALEPDPSPIVGAAAIRSLALEAGLAITVVQDWGECLPFAEAAFDVVHARQVLHHAHNLSLLCREVARVLKPGGLIIATREHVINKPEDLREFLDSHPLHQLYGGENAFTLTQYTSALKSAGFCLKKVFNPWASDINLFPTTRDQIRQILAGRFKLPWPALIPDWVLTWQGSRTSVPGRLYTFVGEKLPVY
jgi:SAM-dependent methyltransferase